MTKLARITIMLLCLCGFVSAQAQELSFPYPTIPATLRTPAERGAWLLEHYWDNFSFTDTTLIHKPEITEQGFANFIDLMPRMSAEATQRGTEVFAKKIYGSANTPQNVRSYFTNLTEQYLYDLSSPLRSDELYCLFLRNYEKYPSAFDNAARERNSYKLKNLMKNRKGETATDFEYVDRKGARRTLFKTKAELTMLYFNDPDCENCHHITAELAQDNVFTANQRLKVIAVYPDADTDMWKKEPQQFPKSWTDAYSPGGEIIARQLYFIRATPAIYLLDKDKKVIVKDGTVEEVRNAIKGLTTGAKMQPGH